MIQRADSKMVLVVFALMLHALVKAQSTTQASFTSSTDNTECEQTMVDLGFLLDSSSSEGLHNFQIEVNFVRDFVNHFDIGPNAVQVGLVTFDTSIHRQFFLNQYDDKDSVLSALDHIFYSHQATNTDMALDYMRTTFFTAANGARAGVPKILVLLTDGQSNNPTKTAEAAARLKQAGILAFVVGIGPYLNSHELQTIASNLQSVYKVPDFNQLIASLDAIKNSFCHHVVQNVTHQNTTNCGGPKPVDLVFVLDASTSEGYVNFHKELNFVANIISHINVAPSETQVALVTFSTGVHNQFYLNRHPSQSSLLQALRHVTYVSGATYTHAALEFVRVNTLLVNHGRRADAQPIVIVLTDGQSANRAQTVHQAALLKDTGAVVLAVGIGRSVSQYELRHIATNSAHVFNVQHFDFLSAIQQDVLIQACEAVKPTQMIPPECRTNPADIVLLLDSSSSEGKSGFAQIKDFVSNFAKQFQIGPQNVQISAIRFSTFSTVSFYLNTYQSQQALVRAIGNIMYIGGTTRTDLALAKARNEVFTAAHGARDDANRTVILLTDGQSTVQLATTREARYLKEQGTTVITIGVGSRVNHHELETVASDVQHSFAVASFDTLHKIQRELLVETCTEVTPKSTIPPEVTSTSAIPTEVTSTSAIPTEVTSTSAIPTEVTSTSTTTTTTTTTATATTTTTTEVTPKPTIPIECRTNPADIVFLLDSSASEGISGFTQIKTFVSNFVQQFQIGPHNIQISAISFSNTPTVSFYLNTYDNKSDLLRAIHSIRYIGGNTHTDLALALARSQVLTAAHGARPDASKTVILLTDGQSSDRQETQVQARLLKQTGARVVTIGVGDHVNHQELNDVASDIHHSFAVPSFDTLHTIEQELLVETCKAVSPGLAQTTADTGLVG